MTEYPNNVNVSEEYRKVWSRASEFPPNKEQTYHEHNKIQEFIKAKDKTVLEYGCGGGSDTLSYLRRGARVWYVDICPANVEKTTERIIQGGFQGKAWGLTLDATVPVPLGGAYFQIVNCHGVLHHIEDEKIVSALLKEFRRVLRREDGRFYLMLYTEMLRQKFSLHMQSLLGSGTVKGEHEAFGWCTDGANVPYARWYTEEEGRALLDSHGFKTLEARTYNDGDFRTFVAEPSA
jgi:SAM-dependent methyltransferase